jgi:circadian clock protein KaiB
MSPVRRTAAPRARRRNGRAAAGPGPRGSGAYVLKLYVTGLSRASGLAIERVRDVCETHLLGRYELEVVDIYQKPALARDEQILATPTLIKVLPAPLRRYIGNLANVEKVLFGLDLREKR